MKSIKVYWSQIIIKIEPLKISNQNEIIPIAKKFERLLDFLILSPSLINNIKYCNFNMKNYLRSEEKIIYLTKFGTIFNYLLYHHENKSFKWIFIQMVSIFIVYILIVIHFI